MPAFVMVEFGGTGAHDRWPLEDPGALEMTAVEAAEMNRRLVRTPCRVFPVSYFAAQVREWVR